MLFTTLTFALFFVAVLALFRFVPGLRAKKLLLLAASYFFYASWDFPSGLYFLPVLIGSSVLDYWLGLKLYLTPRGERRKRRLYLIISLCVNLGVLLIFKYTVFFARSINDLAGEGTIGVPDIILPLGISFYTFQSMSYSIDAFRRCARPYRSPLDFMLFVSFFPQLIAGPIVRGHQFREQLRRFGKFTVYNLDMGLRIAIVGLVLKLVGDNVAVQVDTMFANVAALTPQDAFFATVGFSMQIFCDFAGYSLIAIGLARCFGFTLPQNFNLPYIAVGLRDFWRRWHVTLSTWLRDYLYIPLGGSRHGLWRTVIALSLTMLLGGLWHGASWNFVIWGAAHGLLLGLGRVVRRAAPAYAGWAETKLVGRLWTWLLTLTIVWLLWVPFRAETLADTLVVYQKLLEVPASLVGGVDIHINSAALAPFVLLFLTYHVIAFKQLPEDRVVRWRSLWAVAYYVVAWFTIQVLYVGEVSFIYFVF